MNRHRAIVGLCMLCALAFSVFAAQSATAATKGTTAFTCKKKTVEGGAGFSKEHCKPTDAVASGAKFEHVAFSENTTTALNATNEKTNPETNGAEPLKTKLTIAGVETELRTPVVHGSGSMENRKNVTTGEHFASGTIELLNTGVEVTKPVGKGCKVFKEAGGKGEGEIATKKLKFTTTELGDNVKIEPNEGTTLTTFFVTCTTKMEALEGEWVISGSTACPTEGATIVCTHPAITAAGGVKKGAVKAGIEGKLTLKGRDPVFDPEGSNTPLSFTTVETP